MWGLEGVCWYRWPGGRVQVVRGRTVRDCLGVGLGVAGGA